MNPTNTASLFDLFRAAKPGDARAIGDKRLREIAVSRQIPLIEKAPDEFAKRIRLLPPKDQAYVLARLAQNLPAAVERRTPSGNVREVWFPVEVSTPTPADLAAQERARSGSVKRTNVETSRERLHTLLDGRQVGSETLQTVVGGAYGYSMQGK